MNIIAVDAGGTKARFALYNFEGINLHQIETESVHPLSIGYDGMAQKLKEGIDALKVLSTEKIELISFGLAGYGQDPKIRLEIESALKKSFKDEIWIIHNDVEIALMASLQHTDGIMLVAGTGSIALRSIKGHKKRAGGWGYLIGDEGAAYWMGRKLLSCFSKMADGRIQKSSLYDLVMDALVLDEASDVILHLNNHPKPKEAIASLAKLLNLAADRKDPVALEIFDQAAYELSLLVKALHYESVERIPVKATGGVFESKAYIIEPLKKYLGQEYQLDMTENPPIYGAYLFAKELLENKG